jgi:hypothetical protein
MKYHAIICTRSSNEPLPLKGLISYYRDANINLTIMLDQKSIFEGYNTALNSLKLESQDDIVILCHDDIEIITDRDEFKSILHKELNTPNVGFVGPAGTTLLDKDATWWKMENRQKGLHRGFVFQGRSRSTMTPNYFGPYGNVVCLDGCFLAAKASTLFFVGMEKPSYLKEEFDFYDIHYTIKSYNSGFFNRAIPIILMHNSNGEMRPSWYTNRQCFQKENRLPIGCK